MDATAAIKKFGLEQAFQYVYKDPEQNLLKMMDWADKFAGENLFPTQRKVIRGILEDPCVFIHYSNANIRENTLLECLRSPIFQAYHDNQPFNDNMLQPCPMLENPDILRQLVAQTGAHSTDLQSPESAEHLCSKCDGYAKCWQPKAQELWKDSPRNKANCR